MKIEIIEKNRVLFNSSKENFEIHPLWLRERVKTDDLVDKNNDQRQFYVQHYVFLYENHN